MSYTLKEYKTMNTIVNEINECFSNGTVPSFFLNNNDETNDVDWAKIKYNTFYKSPEYFFSKFPKGFENLPGADKIIQQAILNALTPLEEMEETKKQINKALEENLSNISINE